MKYVNTIDSFNFSPDDNLSRYLRNVSNYPILTQEEEFELATRYRATKDSKLAYKIITSHLKLVVKVVSQYKGYKLPINEMISEGNIGLINALEKFEPERGFRFSTYAMWWIRAYIQKYIISSWSLVKIGTTSSQKKLFFNLRKVKNNLRLVDDRDLSDDIIIDIAQSLGVAPKEVKDMNQRMSGRDGSLNVCVNSSEDNGVELLSFISDKRPNQEEVMASIEVSKQRKKIFNEAIKILNTREKDILFKRRMLENILTLEEVSKIYNISKERVRQIELNSIKKVQRFVEAIQ